MSQPPKCRTCGKAEWGHVCAGAGWITIGAAPRSAARPSAPAPPVFPSAPAPPVLTPETVRALDDAAFKGIYNAVVAENMRRYPTIIEIDAETVAKNPLGLRRYVPPGKTPHPAPETPHPVMQQSSTPRLKTPQQAETPHSGSRSEKRLRVIAHLLADPEASDRRIAQAVGVDHHTVAAVRRAREKGDEM